MGWKILVARYGFAIACMGACISMICNSVELYKLRNYNGSESEFFLGCVIGGIGIVVAFTKPERE